jgi:photosystem II stability/assembly factor-like uncharacterized protein
MRNLASLFAIFILLSSCGKKETFVPRNFNSVEIETIFYDSILNIHAIDILNDGSLAFAANEGVFGLYNSYKDMWQTSVQRYDSLSLEFRTVAHTATDFFMLSNDNPALLYKTGNQGKMELAYEEHAFGVSYNAMLFWNDKEGIAVGNNMDGCLSIIITRNGGETWEKLTCSNLPKAEEGESIFTASNTIKIVGNKVWIGTAAGNIYSSEDKGFTWKVVKSPMQAIYALDFYDELNGFAIGGANKVTHNLRTTDGGKTWQMVGESLSPEPTSSTQFIPSTNGKELVIIGFKGINFSNDSGESWKQLSKEPFNTIRFLNDSVAYVAGTSRISKVTFRK